MTYQARKIFADIAGLIGLLLISAAIVLGFTTVHPGSGSGGTDGDVPCGSVFGGLPSGTGALTDFGAQVCAGPRSERGADTWAILTPGLILLFVGGIVAANTGRHRSTYIENAAATSDA